MKTREELLNKMKLKLETCYDLAYDSRQLLDNISPDKGTFKAFQRSSQNLSLDIWPMLYLLDELGNNTYDSDWEIEIRTLLHQLEVTIAEKIEDSGINEEYFYDKSKKIAERIYNEFTEEDKMESILFENDENKIKS